MKVCKPDVNKVSLKSLILQLQLTLELSQFNEILSVYSELLVLIANYSFILEDFSSETQALKEKPVSRESEFITQDPARDGLNWYGYAGQNPSNWQDNTGLSTTLDDYNYQKRTEDPDKSVENQRRYDHQAREYALRNQGLTDYGMAIHNNEEFFYNFLDQKFDYQNPLNQLDLDKALGFKTNRKTSESCMLAAMINAYAYLLKNGITGKDIINSIFDNGGNFNYFIGIDINKRQGISSPYCKGLWGLSKSIADTMNLKRSDFVDGFLKDKGSSTDSVYLCPMNKDYFSFVTYWLKNVIDPDINTPLIEGITTSGFVAQHYIFTYSVNQMDSLPADRPNKPNYKRCCYYELKLMGR